MVHQVVIVDDDPEYRNILQTAIRSLGWETHICPTGAAGLEKARDVKPSLIILDINLPDIDGFTLCKKIREDPSLKDVGLLMVTGTYKREEDRLMASTIGADGYILKPFHIADLIAKARAVVEGV